jgi:KipI family sensor histidine kinase inhibitor
MANHDPIIRPVGDSTVLVEFEESISPEVNRRVRQFAHGVETNALTGVIETVPAYRSLMIFFDPFTVDEKTVIEFLTGLSKSKFDMELPDPRLFRIPTVYGGKHGPDLDRVSGLTGFTADEVVRIFSSHRYPLYFVGFFCCIPYLGGIPKELEVPRLASPRISLPVGSVGFAEKQVSFLTTDLPSGWNYIGRTHVKCYDPTDDPPTPLRPGDIIEFPSVSEEEANSGVNKRLAEFCESA